MDKQNKVGAYSAPECSVVALDSSSQICATSLTYPSSTEELGEENGTWSY